jgi:hypothetical protein
LQLLERRQVFGGLLLYRRLARAPRFQYCVEKIDFIIIKGSELVL